MTRDGEEEGLTAAYTRLPMGRDDDYTPEGVDRTLDTEPKEEVIRCHGLADGANRLWIAAAILEDEAKALRAMSADGWELTRPIEDDHGYVRQVRRDRQRTVGDGPG